MAKKSKQSRTIVGRPLTPEMLDVTGGLVNFPPVYSRFDPDGDWTNTYRIFTCHGYRKTGNDNLGLLRIRRRRRDKATFNLNVSQRIVNSEAIVNLIDADIVCKRDALASPVRWTLSNRFIGSDKKPVADLAFEETAQIDNNVLDIKTGDKTVKRNITQPLTADFCLFEAVQRLDFGKTTLPPFSILEGMSLFKTDQHLSCRGGCDFTIGGKTMRLHRFFQLGGGILPYEYYLDDNHRLLIVVTAARAYIMDEKADAVVRKHEESERRSYASKARKAAGGR